MPDLSQITEMAGPLLKMLKPKPTPEGQCEVHIVGSEEMILKLFGKE